jgi:hypothetical protein
MNEVSATFVQIADRLRKTIGEAKPRLEALADDFVGRPLGQEAWSRKQILGHLIDSAANNHQRFVRAQESNEYHGPKYAQQHWVDTQRYDARPWNELVSFWSAYNDHLAHVIEQIPQAKALTRCSVGDDAPVSLFFIADDYVTHLEHHLRQILG